MEKKRNTKGEGSFVMNADGTVTHRKSVGYKANGNRKVLTVTAGSKAACIREMKKKEAAWEKQKGEYCYRDNDLRIMRTALKVSDGTV